MGDLIDFLTASKPSFPSGAPVESPGGDEDNLDEESNIVILVLTLMLMLMLMRILMQ